MSLSGLAGLSGLSRLRDAPIEDTAFRITVRTDYQGTSASNQFTLTPGNGIFDYEINWGDGVVESYTTNTAQTHTYPAAGTYQIAITGTFPHIVFGNREDCKKVLTIDRWGDIVWTSFSNAFFGCSNLVITATDLPNSGNVRMFSSAWRGCSNLTSFPPIDTSGAFSLSNTWSGCNNLTSFPSIDTSLVTNFSYTWFSCASLTSFPSIDTSSASSLNGTWRGCSNLTSFPLIDTSLITNFSYTWRDCYNLTHFPNLDLLAAVQINEFISGSNALTSFTAQVSLSFDISSRQLNAAALNAMYTALPTVTDQTVTVADNPGVEGDDPAIATAKGWTVVGS